MRVAPAVVITDQRAVLQRWARGRSTPARLVLRAKIVLLAAEGKQNRQIAEELGISRQMAGLWRHRFIEQGLKGIEKDAPRGGRRPTARNALEAKIIQYTTQRTPKNATHWSTRTLSMLEGKVISACMNRHRHQEWIKFLKLIDEQTPAELDLHLIVDNYATHKHPKVKAWLKRHPRFHMHFIPTSSSWLNMVERFFRAITDKRIRRGTFRSVWELIDAIEAYIAEHNSNPHPFTWTAQAEQILAKVARARAALDKAAIE